MISRRQAVGLALAAPLLLQAGGPRASTESLKTRVARYIREYASQGMHRTGTDVDLANATWLAEHIQSFGLKPELDEFAFKRVRPITNRLTVGEQVTEGVPLYDCLYTDARGFTGTLGEIGSSADIGVVQAFPRASSAGGRALHKARLAGKHKAIIVIADERMPPGITPTNAEDFSAPFGPPTLQVSNAEAPWINKAAADGIEGSVVAHCDYVDAKGINVGTTIRGRRSELAPLVIMTPRSGL